LKVGDTVNKPKTSAAQRRATDKYIGGLDEIKLRVNKGGREIIKAHAASKGMSLNGYICDLIQRDMGE
jgi:predicted HicB family RNase H-like nuclease